MPSMPRTSIDREPEPDNQCARFTASNGSGLGIGRLSIRFRRNSTRAPRPERDILRSVAVNPLSAGRCLLRSLASAMRALGAFGSIPTPLSWALGRSPGARTGHCSGSLFGHLWSATPLGAFEREDRRLRRKVGETKQRRG